MLLRKTRMLVTGARMLPAVTRIELSEAGMLVTEAKMWFCQARM